LEKGEGKSKKMEGGNLKLSLYITQVKLRNGGGRARQAHNLMRKIKEKKKGTPEDETPVITISIG